MINSCKPLPFLHCFSFEKHLHCKKLVRAERKFSFCQRSVQEMLYEIISLPEFSKSCGHLKLWKCIYQDEKSFSSQKRICNVMLKTTNTTFIEYEKVILGQLAWSVPIRSLIEPLNHKLQI